MTADYPRNSPLFTCPFSPICHPDCRVAGYTPHTGISVNELHYAVMTFPRILILMNLTQQSSQAGCKSCRLCIALRARSWNSAFAPSEENSGHATDQFDFASVLLVPHWRSDPYPRYDLGQSLLWVRPVYARPNRTPRRSGGYRETI